MPIPGRAAPRLIPIPAPPARGTATAARAADSSAWDDYFQKRDTTAAQLRPIVDRLRRARQTGQVKAALRAYLKRFPGRAEPWMTETLGAVVNAYWSEYYQKHDETPIQLLETVALLGRARQFDEVEGAVAAYLRFRGKKAEPWMYETLAVALALNRRGPDQVRQALGFAAYLALRSKDPAHLVSVADVLFLRKIFDPYEVTVGGRKVTVGVGSLLDRAAEVAPHLAVPLMMSANLALETKDPRRMGDALSRLLALGWPGMDETLRLQARQVAETLARALRDEDRSAEADELLARVAEAEGRDLFVRLTWSGDADLDLVVDEPLGATARHASPRTVFGGALVKEGRGGRHAEEVYSCPRAFDGDYTLRVVTIAGDPARPVVEATLEVITREGMPGEQTRTYTVKLADAKPVVVHLTGGRRKEVLPFVAPSPAPSPSPSPAKPTQVAGKKAADRDRRPARPKNPPIVLPPGDPPAGRPR